MKNSGIFLLSLILLTTLVSANGIKISPSSISVNKLVGTDIQIAFNISNEEPTNFTNVSFVPNDYISFPPISPLASGTTQIVTATIKANTNVNQILRIKGFYMSNVGQQNNQVNVSLTKETNGNGLIITPCDKSIMVGDTVIWKNNYDYGLSLHVVGGNIPYANTGVIMNGTISKLFDAVGDFTYQFWLGETPPGIQFNFPVCNIHVTGTNELVNDPQLDGLLTLNVSVNYNPTIMSNIFNVHTSSVKPFIKTQVATMTLTNTGNSSAYNILLSGNWLTFSDNNIELGAGKSTGVIVYATPVVTNTNDTDKSYPITLSVSGNFPTISNNFSLFLQYQNVDNGTVGSTAQLDSLLRGFCERNPTVCQTITVVSGANGSSVSRVPITDDQFRDMLISIMKSNNGQGVLWNYIKEREANSSVYDTQTSLDIAALKLMFQEAQDEQKSTSTGIVIFLIIVSVLGMCGITGVLIYIYKNKKAREALRRY